jgi:shikimate kinase
MKHIVLVGMMGAGKSAVGKILAERLGRPFIDTDARIEEAQRTTITDIFESKGEAIFRKMEIEVIAEALAEPPAVIATGGGAFVQELARNLIKAKSVSFYLQCAPEILWTRLAVTEDRPLLAGGDMLAVVHEMLLTREPLYLLADHTINTGSSDLEEVCVEVMAHREQFE